MTGHYRSKEHKKIQHTTTEHKSSIVLTHQVNKKHKRILNDSEIKDRTKQHKTA